MIITLYLLIPANAIVWPSLLSEAAVSTRCPIFTTSSDIYGRWLGETGQRLKIIHDLDRDLCNVVMCGMVFATMMMMTYYSCFRPSKVCYPV